MSAELVCPACDAVVIESDDGMFYEDTELVCGYCGLEGIVGIDLDEEIAYFSTGDWRYKDRGQPDCDGSCGAVKAYVAEGHKCAWDCPRAKEKLL